MRKILCGAAIASMLSVPAVHAQTVWTGGDDLPTSPLACDGTAAAPAASTPD